MTLRFETYISSPVDEVDKRFVVVVYQEGRGKFKVRRSVQIETNTPVYLVSTIGNRKSEFQEVLLPAVPHALELLFSEGALNISYIEGDALVEFPPEFFNRFDQLKLQELAALAVSGLSVLAKDYAEPLYSDGEIGVLGDRSVTGLQLCILVVFIISIIMYFYGAAVLPLEWMAVSAYCFAAVLFLGIIFRNFTRSLIETGKVLTLCFFCATSVLLMLSLGVLSREFCADSIVKREGIIESMFDDSKTEVMRIRLAYRPNITYLIPKSYLSNRPERLPQAIRADVLSGYFNTHYVTAIEIIP